MLLESAACRTAPRAPQPPGYLLNSARRGGFRAAPGAGAPQAQPAPILGSIPFRRVARGGHRPGATSDGPSRASRGAPSSPAPGRRAPARACRTGGSGRGARSRSLSPARGRGVCNAIVSAGVCVPRDAPSSAFLFRFGLTAKRSRRQGARHRPGGPFFGIEEQEWTTRVLGPVPRPLLSPRPPNGRGRLLAAAR